MIRLYQNGKNDQNSEVLVNPRHILKVLPCIGEGCQIVLTTHDVIFVTESFEQVDAKIGLAFENRW